MMTQLYNQNVRTDNEHKVVTNWLISKTEEIPDLNFSIAAPADIEQMACLLLAVVNIYFSLIDLPLKFRPFIFALAGASVGCLKDKEGWFYLRDWELAIQLIDEEGKTHNALKQRIKRLRDGLEIWQTVKVYRIVQFDRGYSVPILDKEGQVTTNLLGQKQAKGIPSRYKLNVLPVALEILRQHQLNPKSKRGLKSMAMEVKSKLKGSYLNPDSAGRHDYDKKRKCARSFALSNLKKIIEFAREDRDDPVAHIMSVVKEAMSDIRPDDRIDMWLREHVLNYERPKS